MTSSASPGGSTSKKNSLPTRTSTVWPEVIGRMMVENEELPQFGSFASRLHASSWPDLSGHAVQMSMPLLNGTAPLQTAIL